MSFWAYMLHCRGGYFYVGQTDDLERRVGDHQSGLIPGFTADHLPVEHVWSQEFTTCDEAKAAERQIKGWSRAKKLALIRGDWDRISTLAKGKNSPSTSSGKTDTGEGIEALPQSPVEFPPSPVYPELVEGLSFSLQPHAKFAPAKVSATGVRLRLLPDGRLMLRYRVDGASLLALPEPRSPARRDGLWRETCCELFLYDGAGKYREFNFAPSGQWAAYGFAGYRNGGHDYEPLRPPEISTDLGNSVFVLTAFIDARELAGATCAALSAVIVEAGGQTSYWALAHGVEKPDFHDPSCFRVRIASADNP